MQLPPLIQGRIISRYKRFLADVELPDGSRVTAHCPNTGRMTGCWQPGAPVQISHSDNPRRRLAWTLERVDMGRGWVGVNTARVNGVVAEAVLEGHVEALQDYTRMQREVAFQVPGQSRSRLDLMLSAPGRPDALIEIKSVTLLEGECLMFPDAVSERALRHIQTLQAAVERGLRGVILFALNRPEGCCFTPAEHIDPAYARQLREAVAMGVEALALRIRHTADGMAVGERVPIRLTAARGVALPQQ